MFPIRDTQPSYSKPVVSVCLIVMNLLVFLYEFSLDSFSQNEFIFTYGLVPDHFRIANVMTSMFLHGGWMHVLSNMWFLWIFGDNVEDILGHGKYLAFYLLCGVAAALAQTVANPYSRVPMVGASGAIAGVMGAYLVCYPAARVKSVIFFGPVLLRKVRASWLLILWLAAQFLYVNSDVAWAAHLGGFAFGALVGAFWRWRETQARGVLPPPASEPEPVLR